MNMIVKQNKVTGEIVKVEANPKLPRDTNGVIPFAFFEKVKKATAEATEFVVICQEVDGVRVDAVEPNTSNIKTGYRAAFGAMYDKCEKSATEVAMNY